VKQLVKGCEDQEQKKQYQLNDVEEMQAIFPLQRLPILCVERMLMATQFMG
jgi:hypothetical protein